ncbi:lipoprotein [Glaciecola siphonariae]|uniref:Lipoprotein n=1 Tax=Glaciecola siphonariae TaxID=521012 RepID=A0ABV9LX28_9ALTE
MTTRQKLALTAMATLLLCACGQRGPLYLPEQAAPQNQATPTTESDVSNEQGV